MTLVNLGGKTGGTILPVYDGEVFGLTGDNSTSNSVAYQNLINAVQAAGGGSIFIKLRTGYQFKDMQATFSVNAPIEVVAYGAHFLTEASETGITITRGAGASIGYLTFRGINFKGAAGKTSTPLHVIDTDRVGFVDCRVERAAVGLLTQNVATDKASESNWADGLIFNDCTVGHEFRVDAAEGFGGVGSFMQCDFRRVEFNNCATGLYFNCSGANAFRRGRYEASFWIPTSGIGVDTKADFYDFTAKFSAEAYSGGTSLTGIKLRAGSTRWADGDIHLGFPAVIGTPIDDSSADTNHVSYWQDGALRYRKYKGATKTPANVVSITTGGSSIVNTTTKTDIGSVTMYPLDMKASEVYVLEVMADGKNNTGSNVNFTYAISRNGSDIKTSSTFSISSSANRFAVHARFTITVEPGFNGFRLAGFFMHSAAGASGFAGISTGASGVLQPVSISGLDLAADLQTWAFNVTMGTADANADIRPGVTTLTRIR